MVDQEKTYKYDAFISYLHVPNAKLALSIQKRLKHIGKKWYQLRILNIFRDESHFSGIGGLQENIKSGLKNSKTLVVLASKGLCETDKEKPNWVDEEVKEWISFHYPDAYARGEKIPDLPIILCQTSGQIVWDNDEMNFDWDKTDCLPPSLENVYDSEPIWVDFSELCARAEAEGHETVFTRKNLEFKVAQISSAIQNRSVEEILGEDVKQNRIVKAILGSLAILLLLASVLAFFQYNKATKNMQLAMLREGEAKSNMKLAERNADSARSNMELAIKREGEAKANMRLAELHADTSKVNMELAIKREGEAKANLRLAELHRDNAEANLELALFNESVAKKNESIANAQRSRAERLQKLAEAEVKALQANNYLNNPSEEVSDYKLIQLATEAYELFTDNDSTIDEANKRGIFFNSLKDVFQKTIVVENWQVDNEEVNLIAETDKDKFLIVDLNGQGSIIEYDTSFYLKNHKKFNLNEVIESDRLWLSVSYHPRSRILCAQSLTNAPDFFSISENNAVDKLEFNPLHEFDWNGFAITAELAGNRMVIVDKQNLFIYRQEGKTLKFLEKHELPVPDISAIISVNDGLIAFNDRGQYALFNEGESYPIQLMELPVESAKLTNYSLKGNRLVAFDRELNAIVSFIRTSDSFRREDFIMRINGIESKTLLRLSLNATGTVALVATSDKRISMIEFENTGLLPMEIYYSDEIRSMNISDNNTAFVGFSKGKYEFWNLMPDKMYDILRQKNSEKSAMNK